MQTTRVTPIASTITTAQAACLFAPRAHAASSVSVGDRTSRGYAAVRSGSAGDGGGLAHNHGCPLVRQVALIAGSAARDRDGGPSRRTL
ncbi:MAG: hypothetical protein M3256_09530 [Actinomycetota bacterium]|nr:hypothetical protein [Actinomycetota bacterium]